jgi:hypothetical protein
MSEHIHSDGPAPRKPNRSRTPKVVKALGGAGISIHVPQIPRDSRGIAIGPVSVRPDPYVPNRRISDDMPVEISQHATAQALAQFEAALPRRGDPLEALRPALMGLVTGQPMNVSGIDFDGARARMELAKAAEGERAFAEEWRNHARWYQTMSPDATMSRRDSINPFELAKSAGLPLDVGVQTNLAQVQGGQTLGYVSLDTRVARGTVRPDSFTLYQALAKSAAYQVVDYWPYIDDPGGPLPGSATSGFSNVNSGTLPTDSGIYSLQSINLKLMLDGRAVTMALMAQNNFVSINEQENANAALVVLQTADWMSYHGNPTLFPNQFAGLDASMPTINTFDFQAFFNTNAALQGWSTAQTLFNMIYEVSAVVTSWGRFGRTTHAFMTPNTAGSLQSLVTTLLNQVTNLGGETRGLVVNGDLQGMLTRMGPIQFPMDLVISARDIPAAGQPRGTGASVTFPTTTTNPTPPASVTVAASGAAAVGSAWGEGAGSPYVSGTAHVAYAVASTDVNMNESVLTFSNTIATSTITSSGAAVVTITGTNAGDFTAYRVFRSGTGGSTGSPFAGPSGSSSPTAYRFIGAVAASGATAVTFADLNTVLPGGERIYLLDMRQEDGALDYRYLLPLTRVELFAQNLYMPWAVCSIGAVRNRIPKFHALIINYIPDNPLWNPLGANV